MAEINLKTLTTGGGAVDTTQSFVIACSDETTPIVITALPEVTFRMPYDFTLSSVRASLTTAQTSGSIFTVDVFENGVSILSTLITIDNTEKTSVTATTQPVVDTTFLVSDDEITINVTQIGSGTATGLKVYLIGTKV
jgi:hypothetical protein